MQTAITQNAAVQRTLVEQSLDSVNKLSTSMAAVQKNTQDFPPLPARAWTPWALRSRASPTTSRTASTPWQLDQKLTDIQNTLQNVDSKMPRPSCGKSPPRQPHHLWRTRSIPMASPPRLRQLTCSIPTVFAISMESTMIWRAGISGLPEIYNDNRSRLQRAILSGEIAFHAGVSAGLSDAYNKVVENYPKKFSKPLLQNAKRILPGGTRPKSRRQSRAAHRSPPNTPARTKPSAPPQN